MKTLHEKYGADLEIIALPCDQFGGQELGTDAAVAEFASANGPFPPGTLLTKGDANGDNARPTYQYVRAQTGLGDIKWNFMGKFVVSKDGEVALTEDPEADIAALM